MNRSAIFIALVLAILLAVIASIVAYLFGHFGDLLVQLVATFFGTILALAVGLLVFESQIRKKRKDLRIILKAELQETIKEVDRTKANLRNDNVITGVIYMQPLAIEHAAKSGEFPTLFVEELLSAARQFHTYNLKVSRFFATVGRTGKYLHHQLTEDEENAINRLMESIVGNADEVKERCNKLLQNENLQ